MEKQELIEKINDALADEFEVDESVITPEAPIKETLEIGQSQPRGPGCSHRVKLRHQDPGNRSVPHQDLLRSLRFRL